MTSDYPFRICWQKEQASRIFRTEALEGDDAVFLATHSPIHGFDLVGRGTADFASADEQSVLDTMADPDRRHAFCVVQGEPGSGKSHLIRWLSVNWPDGRDVKLLLRRADGSLEGALRQLRERLPPEFHEHFEGLGVKQKASHQGRANNFLSWLANTLDPGHYDDKIGDEAWCGQNRPGDILSHAKVKEHWKAPSRILKLLEGAEGKRNSASASFDIFDVAELGQLTPSVRHTFGAAARDLARRIESESDLITEYRAANWLADDLAAQRRSELPFTVALVDVLNRRRNDSIQNVLGVSAAGLKMLFRRIRQQLRITGHRLVLLLEDITSWEGLDDSLIDVLTFNSEASGGDDDVDVCPLISVVGLTPHYFEKLQGNYKQRITHEIRLGKSTGGLQDVASLRDPAERSYFVTRYLAAVRAGDARLRAWRDDLRDMPALPPPNVCTTCPKQPSCHALFGAHDGIGLFPFNGTALDRFFDSLKVDDNGQTWRTPRGLLQAVLSPCLAQPELLDDGAFPGRIIESSAIERTRLPENAVSGRLGAIIGARVDDDADRSRYRRAVSFWGDPESADTFEIDGSLVFAGIPAALFAAFELPWLGGTAASGASIIATPPLALMPVEVPSTSSTNDTDPSVGDLSPSTAEDPLKSDETSGITKTLKRQEPRSTKVAPPPRNRRSQTQREQMREELRSWAAGGSVTSVSLWNDLLYQMIGALDPRSMGVAPSLFQRVVTSDMVKLQGSTTALRQYLVVPPEDWVRAGFEGVLDLELKSAMTDGDRAYARRNIALLMRRLEALVAGYLRRRLPLTSSGAIWSPVGAMAQVLQARAWLRGSVAPDAPTIEQIRVLLSDEDEALSDPASRSAPWMDWLNATRPWHERIRSELRAMVSLAVDGGAAGAALIDASELAGAVARMRERGFMDEVPDQGSGLADGMGKARELVESWKSARMRIVQIEFGQIKNRVQTIAGLLRGRTVVAHLDRLDTIITGTSALLPNQSTDLVTAWVKERQRLLTRLQPDASAVEDLIVAFDDEGDIPAAMPLRLKWLSHAPARALDDTLTLANAGEKAVAALHQHARDYLREGRQAGSLDAVKAIGRALQQVSETGEQVKDAA